MGRLLGLDVFDSLLSTQQRDAGKCESQCGQTGTGLMLVMSVEKEPHQQTDSTANLLSIHFSKFHTIPGKNTQKLLDLRLWN